MASYEVSGKLKVKMEEQSLSSGFTKREFVLTTEEQYPQDIKFELIKDKTSAIDKFNVNDTIKVSFNLRGNEYNGKYYVKQKPQALLFLLRWTRWPICLLQPHHQDRHLRISMTLARTTYRSDKVRLNRI